MAGGLFSEARNGAPKGRYAQELIKNESQASFAENLADIVGYGRINVLWKGSLSSIPDRFKGILQEAPISKQKNNAIFHCRITSIYGTPFFSLMIPAISTSLPMSLGISQILGTTGHIY